MTKYVVLKSTVHSTFDAGFGMLGYEIVEFVESEDSVDLPKDLIGRNVNRKAIEIAARRRAE